jgi:hypothetical protein
MVNMVSAHMGRMMRMHLVNYLVALLVIYDTVLIRHSVASAKADVFEKIGITYSINSLKLPNYLRKWMRLKADGLNICVKRLDPLLLIYPHQLEISLI